MTPAEASQARREASIRRSHRIDALGADQLLNFIYRLAVIIPADVDRVLDEFDANAPKPRIEPKLHPVTFGGRGRECEPGLLAVCQLRQCEQWHVHIEDGRNLSGLEQLVRDHSGIKP